MSENLNDKLKSLIAKSQEADQFFWNNEPIMILRDPETVPDNIRIGICRIISGAATTEKLENVILTPVMEYYNEHETVVEYIRSHKKDEDRHFHQLNSYLMKTFTFEKSEKSFSDRLFYDVVFPKVSKLFYRKPIYAVIILRAYERISLDFYKAIRDGARANGLIHLADLLDIVTKDELRHLAGLETILKIEADRGKKLKAYEYKLLKGLLYFLLLDITQTKWAVHNYEMRKHLMDIGVDCEKLYKDCQNGVNETLSLVKEINS